MANKLVAVFLVCVVVMAAMQTPTAAAENKYDARYRECFIACEDKCKKNGQGVSFCEVKCDEDCTQKEAADKLHIRLDKVLD